MQFFLLTELFGAIIVVDFNGFELEVEAVFFHKSIIVNLVHVFRMYVRTNSQCSTGLSGAE